MDRARRSKPKHILISVIEVAARWNHTTERRVRQKYCWAREAAEAERLEKMLKIENEESAPKDDLALAIQNRNKARAGQADSFFDSLIDKYTKKAEKKSTKKSPGSAKKTKRKA